MLRDLVSNLKGNSTLVPLVRTADANGVGVDLAGFRSAMIFANVGASGDTLSATVKIELEVQHSDDNSTFVACANADLSASVVGTNLGTMALIDAPGEASLLYVVGYKGQKRYIRVVANITGTHSSGTSISAIVVKGDPEQAPTS